LVYNCDLLVRKSVKDNIRDETKIVTLTLSYNLELSCELSYRKQANTYFTN